jgi:hypothetical protein
MSKTSAKSDLAGLADPQAFVRHSIAVIVRPITVFVRLRHVPPGN